MIIITVALIVFCTVGVASADPADSTIFILPHISAEPGQLVSLPLSISTVHKIGAFEFLFEFEQGSLDAEYLSLDNTRSEGIELHLTWFTNLGLDAIRGFVIFVPPDAYIPAGDGPVANLMLTSDASIPKGSLLPLSFCCDNEFPAENGISDPLGIYYVPDFNHGSILFKVDPAGALERGDVDLNGKSYEIADLNLMFEQLETGIASYVDAEAQTENADINADGFPWTISDVVLMRAIVFEHTKPLLSSREVLHMSGDSIWFDGYTGAPTSEFDIPVYFSNSLTANGISFKINYDADELGLVSYSLSGSRLPSEWDRVSAIERSSGTMFYGMPDNPDSTQGNSLPPGSGLAVTLTFEVRNPPEDRIRFHFERLQDLGQANGYSTPYDFSWSFASFQQIDTDIFLTFVQGDADGSGAIDIDDVVYLIDYIYQGGPAPQVFETGDFNGDSVIDIDDAIALLEYIFG